MQLAAYRKDNRKRQAGQWRRRLGVLACAVCLGVLAVAAFLWGNRVIGAAASVRAAIIDSPYFRVREIQVRGSNKLSGSEIVAIAGLRHGMNMWRIAPAAIESRIARHPWVRRVLVRREFPRRIVIDVEERTPKAIVAIGRLYYVDAEGVLFKEVGAGENVQFPLLTGLRADLLARPDPELRRRIQDAIRLGDLMARDARTISEIHFESPERVVLYTTAFPVALRMGSGDWESKIQRLDRVLGLWKGNENRLASLDVSFRDQVVARLRPRQ